MTATQMFQSFQQELGTPNNDAVTSLLAAGFLNKAQQAVYDAHFYNLEEKRKTGSDPANNTENSIQNAEVFHALKVDLPPQTTVNSFLVFPQNLVHLADVLVLRPSDDGCEENRPLVEAKFMPESDIRPSQANVMYKAIWEDEDVDPIGWYQPKFRFATVDFVKGIQLYPLTENGASLEFDVQLVYYVNPPEIRVKTPPNEVAQYGGTPNFIQVFQDQNCFLNASLHETVVRKAVQLFNQSVTDYTAAGTEAAILDTGNV